MAAGYRVAVTMRMTLKGNGAFDDRDCLATDWVRLLEDWGAVPFYVPNCLGDPVTWLSVMAPDLLVLTGGDDWGATPERDETEATLYRHAVCANLPVLGICRGMQVVNHLEGGVLAPVQNHVAKPHPVEFRGMLASLYGTTAEVNSFHNHGIAPSGLADSLLPVAVDSDGYIEAAVHRSASVATLMWHPERAGAPAGDRALFNLLLTKGTLSP